MGEFERSGKGLCLWASISYLWPIYDLLERKKTFVFLIKRHFKTSRKKEKKSAFSNEKFYDINYRHVKNIGTWD